MSRPLPAQPQPNDGTPPEGFIEIFTGWHPVPTDSAQSTEVVVWVLIVLCVASVVAFVCNKLWRLQED